MGLTAKSTAQITANTTAAAAGLAGGISGGLAGSGAGAQSQNTTTNMVEAVISGDSTVTSTGSGDAVKLSATDNSSIQAQSIGAALSVGLGTVGIAASIGAALATNTITNSVLASVEGSTLNVAGDVEITALSTANIDASSIGLAGALAAGGVGVSAEGAGSASTNQIDDSVEASIKSATEGGSTTASNVTSSGAVALTASDNATINATAGSAALGGGFGVGAAFNLAVGISISSDSIGSSSTPDLVKAFIDDSTISAAQGVSVTAQAKQETIDALTVAGTLNATVAAAVSVAFAGAGAGSQNIVYQTVEAGICGGSIVTSSAGAVSLNANDNADINAACGAAALSVAASGVAFVAGTIGATVATNTIGETDEALIDGSTVTANGGVQGVGVGLTAVSTATINANAVAGAGSLGGAVGGGYSGSGAGATTTNTTTNAVEAEIQGGSNVTSKGSGDSVTLSASDNSNIDSDTGGIAGSVGFGIAAVGISVGAAVSTNTITNTAEASVDDSTVNAAGAVSLTAQSTSEIDAMSAGYAGALVGAGVAVGFAGAGSGTNNQVNNTIEAEIEGGSTVTTTQGGDVSLTATDNAKIFSDAGATGIGLSGGPVAISGVVGVAEAQNDIGNTSNITEALIQTSTVQAAGSITLSAQSNANIQSVTQTGAVSTAAGAYAGAATGAGTEATNTITDQITALIQDANNTGGSNNEVTANGPIQLTANDAPSIVANGSGAAVAASAGLASISLSASGAVATNTINDTVGAGIDNGYVHTTKGDVTLMATSTASIGVTASAAAFSAAFSLGNASGGGGASATNTITNTIQAYVDDGSNVKTPGNVTIQAQDTPTIGAMISAQAISAGITGFSVGVSNTTNTITDTVSSYVDSSTINAGGAISITTTSTENITASTDVNAFSGTIYGGAFAGSTATTTIGGTVQAYANQANLTGSTAMVQATANMTADANATGAGGATGCLVSLTPTATLEENTLAYVSGTVNLTGALAISAQANNTATATPKSDLVGLVASSGMTATASISGETYAYLGEGTTLTAGALSISATDPNNTANATDKTTGIGGFSNANLTAKTTISPDVEAFVGPPPNTTATNAPTTITVPGTVTVTATSNNSTTTDANTFGLGGVTLENQTVTSTIGGTTDTYVGGMVTVVNAPEFNLTATDSSTPSATAEMQGFSLVGVQGARVTSAVNHDVEAYVADGANVTSQALDLQATSTANPYADATGTAGGAVTLGSLTVGTDVGPDQTTGDGGNTFADIGSNATVNAGALTLSAQATNYNNSPVPPYFAECYLLGIGLLVSNAQLNDTADAASNVAAYIGNQSVVGANGPLQITATSNSTPVVDLNVGAGGIVAHAAATSNAQVDGTTKAYIDENTTITKATQLQVTATDADCATDSAEADAGGAVSVQSTNTQATLTPTITATINTGVHVNCTGTVAVEATSTQAQGSATAKGYGGGIVNVGSPNATVTSTPLVSASIDTQANITAGADVTVLAQALSENVSNANNYINNVNPSANTITFVSHGLQTGDIVEYVPGEPNGPASEIQTPAGPLPSTDYQVIVVDDNTLQLGAVFNAGETQAGDATTEVALPGSAPPPGGIDPTRDEIRFATPDLFQTGEAVDYNTNGTMSIIDPNENAGVTSAGTFYVRVIDPYTIKLYTTLAAAEATPESFTPSTLQNGTFAQNPLGLTNNEAVTYQDDTSYPFNTLGVNLTGPGLDPSNQPIPSGSNIYIGLNDLKNGDALIYETNAATSPIGGLVNGQVYYVIKAHPTDTTIELATSLYNTQSHTVKGKTTPPQPITLTPDTSATGSADTELLIRPTLGTDIDVQPSSVSNNQITIGANSLQTGDRVFDQTSGTPIGGLTTGQAYYVIVVNPTTIELDSSYADATSATPSPIALGAGATDTQTFVTQLEDGQTLFVANATKNSFQLSAMPGGPALDLDPQETGGSNFISPDGVRLDASSGQQNLVIALTSWTPSAGDELFGPGGESLRALSAEPGSGISSADAEGGNGGIVAHGHPVATVTFDPTTSAELDANQVTAGGNVTVEAQSAADTFANANTTSGGFIESGEADAYTYYGNSGKTNNTTRTTAEIGPGVTITATDAFTLAASTSDQSSVYASAGGGGAVATASATAEGDNYTTTNANVGGGTSITANTVSISAENSEVSESSNPTAEAAGLFGSANAYGKANDTPAANVQIGGSGTQITGNDGVDLLALDENFKPALNMTAHDYAIGLGGNNNPTTTYHYATNVTAAQGSTVSAGPRDPKTPLTAADSVPGGSLSNLALLVQSQDVNDIATYTQTVSWDANVNILSTANLVINSMGQITADHNVAVTDNGSPVTTGDTVSGTAVVTVVNDAPGQVLFIGPNGVENGNDKSNPAPASSYPLFTFDYAMQNVTITNLSAVNLQINEIYVDDTKQENSPTKPVDVEIDSPNYPTKNVPMGFNIAFNFPATTVDIENQQDAAGSQSASDINLNGPIENPTGPTTIINKRGNINATSTNAVIWTNTLDIEASGNIGAGPASPNLVSADLIESEDQATGAIRNIGLTAIATTGSVGLDITARVRDGNTGLLIVPLQEISAGQNINVTLENSMLDPASTVPVAATVAVQNYNSPAKVDPLNYETYFHPDSTGPTPDPGIFVNLAKATTIADTTYQFGFNASGIAYANPGLTAGGNIIVEAKHAKPADPRINVLGTTDLTGTTGYIDTTINGSLTYRETQGAMRVGTISSTNNNVILAIPEGTTTGADLDVVQNDLGNGLISAATTVVALVGDNLTTYGNKLPTGSVLTAGTSITITLDYAPGAGPHPTTGSTVNINGLIASPVTTITGGSENDVINLNYAHGINSAATSVMPKSALGTAIVNVDGGGGQNSLKVDDSAYRDGDTGVMTGSEINGLGMGGYGIHYANIQQSLEIDLSNNATNQVSIAGPNPNNFTVLATVCPTTVVGSAGPTGSAGLPGIDNIVVGAAVDTATTVMEDYSLNGADTSIPLNSSHNGSVGADAGDLNRIKGALTYESNGGTDSLLVNDMASSDGPAQGLPANSDHDPAYGYDYIVTPTSIENDPSKVNTPTVHTPPARTFAGITYNSSSTAANNSVSFLRLDGTNLTNQFTVTPSNTTTYLINGAMPYSADRTDGGDSLVLNTASLPSASVANLQLYTTPNTFPDMPQTYPQDAAELASKTGNGEYTFVSGKKAYAQPVYFLSIEQLSKTAPVVHINPIYFPFGTALTNALLSGTATATVDGETVNVAGNFSFTNTMLIGTVPGANQVLMEDVTFTPVNNAFTTVQTQVTVNVGYSLVVTNAADPTTLLSGTLRAAVAQANADATRGVSDTITFNTKAMGTSTITLSQGVLELSGASGSSLGAGPPTTDGLSFNGTSDYVEVPTSPSLQSPALNSTATLSAWVYLNELPSTAGHIMTIIGDSDFANDLDLQIGTNNEAYLYAGDINPGTGNFVASKTVLQTGVWYWIAGTYQTGSNGAGLLQLYINGNLDASQFGTFAHATNPNPVTIGWDYVFAGRYFNGLIADPSIWDSVETQAQIHSQMTTQLQGNESGLLAAWLFSEQTGTTAKDLTANGNNGTLASASMWTSSLPTVTTETIDAGTTPITISGNDATEIFQVDTGVSALLNNLTITKGMLSGNGGIGGGGIDNNGRLTLTNCVVSYDTVVGDGGGGIYSNGQQSVLTLTNCSFAHDTSSNDGGAVVNGDQLTVTDCQFSDDSAAANGGAIENRATLTLTGSTIAGCYATYGAAIDATGTAALVSNTTLADNGLSAAGAECREGGAIFNVATLTLFDDTVSGNSAQAGGGVYNYPTYGTLAVTDTVIADNISSNDPDVDGAVSGTNNLIGNGSGLTGISNGASGNQVGTASSPIKPLLAPLGSYGGANQTMALLPGSPALRGGVAVTGITTDERGVARPATAPDIGAFQSQGFTITAKAGTTPQHVTVGTAFATPLAVTVTAKVATEPVNGGVVEFTVTNGSTGAGATFAGNQTAAATITAGVATAPTLTANNTAGSFTAAASIAGSSATAASFSLTNAAAAPSVFTKLVYVSGSGQSAAASSAFTAPLIVEAIDQFGRGMNNVAVTFTAPSTGASATLSSPSAVSGQPGEVEVTATANQVTSATAYTVTASATLPSGSKTTVSFSLTNTARSLQYSLIVTNATDPATLLSGTLRAAVFQANSDAASGVFDTITFNTTAMGTSSITLTQGELELTASKGTVTIDGGDPITVSGNDASRVFKIDSGASIAMSGLIIEDGGNSSYGAGIVNDGTLTLTDSVVSTNTSSSVGGGIYNDGTLTLASSTVSGNTSINGGGGISNYNTLMLNGSTVAGNKSDDGAGIRTQGGTLTLTGSTVSGNSAVSGGGGGIESEGGTVSVLQESAITNNVATYGYGGGIDSDGTLTVNDSTISGNTGNSRGGGIATEDVGAVATLLNSTVADNTGKYGGGIYNDGTLLTLTNSTLSGNVATSKNASYGGGGILSFSQMSLTDCTVSGNSAPSAAGGGIGTIGTLTLQDTIVSANTAPTGPDIRGAINTDNGHNLLGTALSSATHGTGDVFTDNPALGSLGNNTGPTQTMALLPGSPAIGAGVAIAGITTDQRGVSRPATAPDIGAFQTAQVGTVKFITSNGAKTTTTVGTSFGTPAPEVEVLDPAGKPMSDATVTLTLPTSGASGKTAGSHTITTNAQGIADVPVLTANTVAGSWQLTASAGSASATLTMTNTPGAPQVKVSSGSGQTVTDAGSFAPLVVAVTDQYGNVIAGATVTFTVSKSGSLYLADFPGKTETATATSNKSGLATAPTLTSRDVSSGTFTVTASAAGGTLSATFTLTVEIVS